MNHPFATPIKDGKLAWIMSGGVFLLMLLPFEEILLGGLISKILGKKKNPQKKNAYRTPPFMDSLSTLMAQANSLDYFLQVAATGATIHKYANLRQILLRRMAMIDREPSEENIKKLQDQVNNIINIINKRSNPEGASELISEAEDLNHILQTTATSATIHSFGNLRNKLMGYAILLKEYPSQDLINRLQKTIIEVKSILGRRYGYSIST